MRDPFVNKNHWWKTHEPVPNRDPCRRPPAQARPGTLSRPASSPGRGVFHRVDSRCRRHPVTRSDESLSPFLQGRGAVTEPKPAPCLDGPRQRAIVAHLVPRWLRKIKPSDWMVGCLGCCCSTPSDTCQRTQWSWARRWPRLPRCAAPPSSP